MIKVGVIGAGFAGSFHARAYAKTPGAEVSIIADQNEAKATALAAEVGARAETDADTILRDPTITVVDVALPTPLHPEYAIRALEAGKHVVIEKPLALSVEEADAMIDAAHRSGKFLMVAHVLRFWPEYIAIRKVLQSGRLGQPRIATAHRLSNLPQWATWFRDPAMTGRVGARSSYSRSRHAQLVVWTTPVGQGHRRARRDGRLGSCDHPDRL